MFGNNGTGRCAFWSILCYSEVSSHDLEIRYLEKLGTMEHLAQHLSCKGHPIIIHWLSEQMLGQFSCFLQQATSSFLSPVIFTERDLPQGQTTEGLSFLGLTKGSNSSAPKSLTCISLPSFRCKTSPSDCPRALLQAGDRNRLFTALLLKRLVLFLLSPQCLSEMSRVSTGRHTRRASISCKRQDTLPTSPTLPGPRWAWPGPAAELGLPTSHSVMC